MLVAFITGIVAVVKSKDRSAWVYTSIVTGVCAILFALLHSLFMVINWIMDQQKSFVKRFWWIWVIICLGVGVFIYTAVYDQKHDGRSANDSTLLNSAQAEQILIKI